MTSGQKGLLIGGVAVAGVLLGVCCVGGVAYLLLRGGDEKPQESGPVATTESPRDIAPTPTPTPRPPVETTVPPPPGPRIDPAVAAQAHRSEVATREAAIERNTVVSETGLSVALPAGTVAEGEQIRIERVAQPPPLPEGFTSASETYDVRLPDRLRGQATPAAVRVPISDAAAARDESRAYLIGQHNGSEWQFVPAEVVDRYLVASVEHFSPITGTWISPRASPASAEERAALRIGGPEFVSLRIVGTDAFMLLNIANCRTAYAPAPHNSHVRVPRVRLLVSRPVGGRAPARTGLAPYSTARAAEWVMNTGSEDWLRGPGEKLIHLEFTANMLAEANVDSETLVGANGLKWWVALQPIFADGTEGAVSPAITVPVGVAQALTLLTQGLVARLSPEQGANLLEAARANPVIIFPESTSGRENYFGAWTGVRPVIQSALGWTSILEPLSFIEMNPSQSQFGRVVSHEWGHYIHNLAYGNSAFGAFPGGGHEAWRQADSRELAMSEDLASLFGEMGSGQGYPAAAGPAGGQLTRYARTPDLAGQPPDQFWPNNKNMDAVAVEAVPATIMGRAIRLYGLELVYGFVLRFGLPSNIIDFYRTATLTLIAHPNRVPELQTICIEEGVSWSVLGTVVGTRSDDEEPKGIDGARVRLVWVEDPTKQVSDQETTTTLGGFFGLRVPPGAIQFEVTARGWAMPKDEPFRYEVDTSLPTNAPRIDMEPFEMVPVLPPVVTITAPTQGATLTERVVTVTGTVEGTKDGLPDGEPIETVRIIIARQGFNVAVSNGEFSQELLLAPGENQIFVVARNDVGRTEASVTVTADIQATVLKVILTWEGGGTDVDLWVTDPGGVRTGYTNKQPAEGRQLDIDDQDGLGPETYTMTRPIPGAYRVRINYYRGGAPETFRVRWVIWEGTPQEATGSRGGSLSEQDRNGNPEVKAGANYSFPIQVPPMSSGQ